VGGKVATTYAQANVEVKYVVGVAVVVAVDVAVANAVVDHMWMSKLLCSAVGLAMTSSSDSK
jgi:hypothetical protein